MDKYVAAPVRQPMSKEKLFIHIARNRIDQKTSPMALRGRRCGDGRDSQNYVEALFGADLGYIFCSIAATREIMGARYNDDLTNQVVNTVVNCVAPEKDKIFVHTDNHHGNENTF